MGLDQWAFRVKNKAVLNRFQERKESERIMNKKVIDKHHSLWE